MVIKALILDVDGVLTDGRLIYGPEGELLKVFHAHDGLGIKLLMAAGIFVAVISGRKSSALEQRLDDLGIDHKVLNCRDKVTALSDLSNKLNLTLAEIAFMGDDLIDLAAMRVAGYALAPSNAVTDVKKIADYVTDTSGGQGAVREACEHILNLKGKTLASYFEPSETNQQ